MSAKQLIKFLLILGFSFAGCYGLLYVSSGSAASIFEEILSAFLVIATLLSTLSFALFTYLDNISKELTELRNEVNRAAYVAAHEKLSAVKKEIVYNAGLVIGLFLIERMTKGGAIYLVGHLTPDQGQQAMFLFLSLRGALLITAIWAAIIQLRGFLVAIEYRDIIAKNRK